MEKVGAFLGIVFQKRHVLGRIGRVRQKHAFVHAAQDGALLVAGKIVAGMLGQERCDPLQGLLVRGAAVPAGVHGRQGGGQVRADGLDGENHVGQARLDGAGRHAVVFGRLGVLDEDQPAGGVQVAQAPGTVGTGPRQDDSHPARSLVPGQGNQESVDGTVHYARFPGRQDELAAFDRQLVAGRQDMDHARGGRFPAGQFLDGELGQGGEDGGELAFGVLAGMGDDDKGGIELGGQGAEEGGERRQAAGRGSDSHDREGQAVVGDRGRGIGGLDHGGLPGKTA